MPPRTRLTRKTGQSASTDGDDGKPNSLVGRWLATNLAGLICGVVAVVLSIGVGSMTHVGSTDDWHHSIGTLRYDVEACCPLVPTIESLLEHKALISEWPVAVDD